MIRNIFKKGMDRIREFGRKVGAVASQARVERTESKEEEKHRTTLKEAKDKHSKARTKKHRKYAEGKKFRIRSIQRFLPKKKIPGTKQKLTARAYMLNNKDRDLKSYSMSFTSTGAAGKKRHQRMIQRGKVVECFEWPDSGASCRASMDRHLTIAGK